MDFENSFVVIKTIDNMPRVIFWRMDEFIVMILPFFIGVCLGSILVTISGPFLKHFYTKALKKYPTGTLQHRLYWNLPKDAFEKSGKLKNIPGSHLRHFSL